MLKALSRRPRSSFQYSMTLIRAVCKTQSDEALALARRCGVPVPQKKGES